MREGQKRRLRVFARAVVPPARFHSTKRGKRGYVRRQSRQEERRARDGTSEGGGSGNTASAD